MASVIMLTSCGHEVETKKNIETSAVTPIVVPDESSTAEVTTTTAATTTSKTEKKAKTTTTKKEKEYLVYKPSTHYVHKSTCEWVNDECYKIDSTEGLQVRLCEDCNPKIDVVEEYVEPVATYAAPQIDTYVEEYVAETTPAATSVVTEAPKSTEAAADNSGYVDDYSRQLLAEIVYHEYGADWVATEEKAKIAAGVMNRVNDGRFADTVYDVLVTPGQFTGYTPGCCTPTDDCYAAVDYYFANQDEFGNYNSWWGDSVTNHFYYQ